MEWERERDFLFHKSFSHFLFIPFTPFCPWNFPEIAADIWCIGIYWKPRWHFYYSFHLIAVLWKLHSPYGRYFLVELLRNSVLFNILEAILLRFQFISCHSSITRYDHPFMLLENQYASEIEMWRCTSSHTKEQRLRQRMQLNFPLKFLWVQ